MGGGGVCMCVRVWKRIRFFYLGEVNKYFIWFSILEGEVNLIVVVFFKFCGRFFYFKYLGL